MINNLPVKRVPFHEHLGVIVDSKLDFNEHINTVLLNVNSFTLKILICFTTALPLNDM